MPEIRNNNGNITYIVVSILFVLFLTGFGLCLAQNNRTDDRVSDLNAKIDNCIDKIYNDISGPRGIKEKMFEIDKRLDRMETRGCCDPQGNQGIQGRQGIRGNQGIQGKQGPQGSRGIQGKQGEQGKLSD